MCTEIVFQIRGLYRERQQETCLGWWGLLSLAIFLQAAAPHELFLRVFQASKVKPEAGVERRGGLKSNGFDQIDQKRSPVTNEIEHNAYISDSVPVGL